MSEQVLKFQPDRQLYLRGFDGYGATAALHEATPNSFMVSGVFRDASDFAVLVIYDVDDFYGHPRLKYLPDPNLAGMVLEFDLHYAGLSPLDSPKYPTIDWPYLDVAKWDGTTAQIPLFANATSVGSGPVAASAQFTFTFDGDEDGDTLTLWFENVAFTYPGGGTTSTEQIAAFLANAINTEDWSAVGGTYSLSATSADGLLTVTADPAGSDGNMIRMYAVSSAPSRLNVTATPVQFSGGSSDVTWHVTLDFTALGIDSVRQMWLTFAPLLADSAAYADTNWDATFTNWGITADPNNIDALQVAGPGSVRIEESDAWTIFDGTWQITSTGWFSKGFAKVSGNISDFCKISYWCGSGHDLWLGTSLADNCGQFSISIDGGSSILMDTYLAVDPSVAINTRRQIATGIAAGQHSVVLTISGKNSDSIGTNCTFDFLEAAIPSDVPDAPGNWSDRTPAIDYDTQHGYQLSPERLLWMFDSLGFTGPGMRMNEYVGVFWWNQRQVMGETLASATVTFSGFVNGDQIFLDIGGTTIGKSMEAGDSDSTAAAHFAYFINETFSGIWASSSGNVLTVTVRSASAAYQITPFTSSVTSEAATAVVSGVLTGSVAGTWIVDPSQTPALNYGAQCWHRALFAGVQSRGNTVVSSLSLEVVNPPDDPDSGDVWVSRFPDNSQVLTGTVSGALTSLQCAPMASNFLAYQKQAFLQLAELQSTAGLTPNLQLGEFLWWFFPRLWLQPIGYLSETDPISIGMASPHGLSNGDTVQVQGAEGATAANGTWQVTVTDSTHFTIPVSANAPWVAGTGMVSGGGMGYCDAETSAAAVTALGRSLYPFQLPTGDPSVNSYADANFLASRLNQHATEIVEYVQATYPSAVFEVLFPNDVNNPVASTGPSQVGGQLNAYVNFPPEWQSASTAPFQNFTLEQLAFGTTDRNMNSVQAGIAAIRALDWPIANLSYLYPVDNVGVAQWREYRLAKAAGFNRLVPFAMDQICLIGWPVEPPKPDASAQLV